MPTSPYTRVYYAHLPYPGCTVPHMYLRVYRPAHVPQGVYPPWYTGSTPTMVLREATYPPWSSGRLHTHRGTLSGRHIPTVVHSLAGMYLGCTTRVYHTGVSRVYHTGVPHGCTLKSVNGE